jgi:iron complex transport system permease protein
MAVDVGAAVPVTIRFADMLRGRAVFALLSLALLIAVLAELAIGPVSATPAELIAVLRGEGDAVLTAILYEIRAPRVCLGIATAAALALSGCAMQGVLRNPLADPGLIGVTGGASAGAVAAIVLGEGMAFELSREIRPYFLPIAAFIGSGLVTGFVFSVARRAGGTSVATLILAGVAVNAIAGAFIGAMVYISDDRQLRDLTFWNMGSLGGAGWTLAAITSAIVLLSLVGYAGMARALDLFQLGERGAYHAGLNIEKTKRRVAFLTALSVGGATAAAGPIGFIGLVAPHMARLIVGPAHHRVIPASILIGAVLLLFADLAVRNMVPPAEPPIGLATSLIGGPFFLWLLLTRLKNGRGYA